MLLVETSPVIRAPASAVFTFFADMERNYLRWHPDHVAFRWMDPGGLDVGRRFSFEERIAGKLLGKTVAFTRIVDNELIEFAPTSWLFRLVLPRITFRIEANEDGVSLVQEIALRVGPVAAWLNRREFAAVRQHMREEGRNMKALLEADGS